MSDFKVIETEEELERIVEVRLASQKEKFADYDELKQKNDAFESEKAELTEALDKERKTRAELETKVLGYESERLKTTIALNLGLPLELAGRLQGDDEESLRADAERLSEFFKIQDPVPILKDVEPAIVGDNDANWRQVVKDLTI